MSKRLFIAIKVKPDVDTVKRIQRIQSQLEREKIKWVDPSVMHITLKFLGETDEQLIPQITKALENIARQFAATQMELSGIGVFPNPLRPRVLWLGLTENQQVADLAKAIDSAMENLGFEPEDREFKPHLTLGRIKFVANTKKLQSVLEQYKNVYFQDIPVEEIILYQSELFPTGPKYTPLAKFKLK